MNCNRMPDTGVPIYLNGMTCDCLWKEIEASEAAGTITLENTAECDEYDCQPQCNFEGWRVGMTYVPMQPWEELFELDKGLGAGTIFPSLRMPFRGGDR